MRAALFRLSYRRRSLPRRPYCLGNSISIINSNRNNIRRSSHSRRSISIIVIPAAASLGDMSALAAHSNMSYNTAHSQKATETRQQSETSPKHWCTSSRVLDVEKLDETWLATSGVLGVNGDEMYYAEKHCNVEEEELTSETSRCAGHPVAEGAAGGAATTPTADADELVLPLRTILQLLQVPNTNNNRAYIATLTC